MAGPSDAPVEWAGLTRRHPDRCAGHGPGIEDEDMLKNILAAVDFSPVTQDVAAEARALAEAFGAKLWLIHVAAPEPAFVGYDIGPAYIRSAVAAELREQHAALEAWQAELAGSGIDVTARLLPGDPVEKILEEARDMPADRIVIGSHGHGALRDLLMGSVGQGVVRRAECPVLVVPARRAETDDEAS